MVVEWRKVIDLETYAKVYVVIIYRTQNKILLYWQFSWSYENIRST
jgi:hypothetical protein